MIVPLDAEPAPPDVRPADGPVVVVGMGVTGCAVASALTARGHEVVVADDKPDNAASRVSEMGIAGIEVHDATDAGLLRSLVWGAAAVVPSPGVPPRHSSYTFADAVGIPIVSELDLAAQWDSRPIAAITGTNGKTTVTVLVERILNRSEITAVGAGNTDIALVDAIDSNVSTFVVEASSFRLHRARRFAPAVAAWLNLAPDHLDWHVDVRDYAESKARIWTAQGPDDVAVIPFGDADIEPWTSGIRSRRVTFAAPQHLDAPCDVRFEHGVLIAHDQDIVAAGELPRRRPHDLSNAAAAAAIALEMGASADAAATELRSFDGLPHRLAHAGRIGDVSFHDDSKATAPHATVAALRGFSDAILIAGGRNKGLDLNELAAIAAHLRGVVAIGESAPDLVASFSQPECDHIELAHANSMSEAVEIAYDMAQPCGDVVLSPGCASFDWYSSYRERGNHFIAAVSGLAESLGLRASSGERR